ncbi:MAG: TonB-dependent receptor plug domain-containing protein, partial [Aurantibacter sp.]
MNKTFFGLCATALVYTSTAAQARQQQTDSLDLQELNEVIVSDSRFELKRENSGKNIIKISSEELGRYEGKSVADIINAKSGIEIAGSRGHDGNILGVFARGGRGRQTLVLIDGVRVSDPSSFSQEYDLRMLSTARIESIEIIKGAASTLYGTNAATAVINITTKRASDKKASLTLQTSRGTNHTTENQNYALAHAMNTVLLSGSLDRFTYRVDFSNRYSDGLSANVTPMNEEDVFSKFNVGMKIGVRFSDDFSLNLYGDQSKIKTEYDDSFSLLDAPYVFISDQKRAGLSAKYGYKNGSLQLNAAIAEYASENKSNFPNSFEGKNYAIDFFNKLSFSKRLYTVLGVNLIKDQADFEPRKEFTITDPYINAVYVSSFGLNINAGLRLNIHSEYGNNLVYSANPSYVIKMGENKLKFMGSYATSYITPSLTQLFGNFGANPNLEPEDDRTMEGGLEFSSNDKLRLTTLYFNRKEKNFVFFDGANSRYLNSPNKIDAQGVE